MAGQVILGWTENNERIKCLAEGHNTDSAGSETQTGNPKISSEPLHSALTTYI